jgi:arylsulfatase A-like enzyme
MLGQHGRFEKHFFYEPAVRIPLIIRWQGQITGSRRVVDLVEMIDILPTVLHLMRLPVPPGLQGIDLEPLLRNQPHSPARSVVFSEYLENEEAMVRSARYKLIVGTGRRVRQDGYQTPQPLPLLGPYQRLYDLDDDPNEIKDLGDDSRLIPIKEELLNRMFDRLVSTRNEHDALPPGLSRLETIHWCLVPRDR